MALSSVLSALLLFFTLVQSGWISSPPSLSGSIFTIPLRFAPENFNVTGTLVKLSPNSEGCEPLEDTSVVGKIVYVAETGCSPRIKAAHVQFAGAIGLIIGRTSIDGGLGFLAWTFDGKPEIDITIPCVEIGNDDHARLKDEIDSGITITLTPDHNQYEDLPYELFTAIMMPFSFMNLIASSIKLFLFLRATDYVLTAPVFILTLESFGNIIRTVWCIDPVYWHQIFNKMAYTVLYSLGVPFTLAGSFLIAYYWQEALRVNRLPNIVQKLQRFRIPAIIAVIVLFAVEIATDVLRGGWSSDITLLYVNTFLYIFFAVSVSAFFLVTGFKLVKSLYFGTVSPQLINKRTNRLKMMIGLLLFSAFSFFVFIFALVVLPFLSNDNGGYDFAVWFLIFAAINSLSTSNIAFICLPKTEGSKDSENNFKSPYSKLINNNEVEMP